MKLLDNAPEGATHYHTTNELAKYYRKDGDLWQWYYDPDDKWIYSTEAFVSLSLMPLPTPQEQTV